MTISYFEESPPSPWSGEPAPPQPDEQRPAHEPAFNAPWQAVAVVVLIVGGYAVQTLFPADAIVEAYAFSPVNLTAQRWPTLITANFLHGSWAHALMNGAFALAFSAPLARLFGPKLMGGLLFFGFYILTGVLGYLLYGLIHWGGSALVVGASVAVSGLMGGAARLIGGHGRPGPIFSRAVLGMGGGWLAVNLIIAAVGGGFLPGTGGAGVAWEAHLTGFLMGVLLIGPFARLAPKDHDIRPH
jgi:membrane associated rhomboid family serine protease